jgi:hypothetical protein
MEVKVLGQSITIRLTPSRERLLKMLKKRFNLSKTSDAIDIALRISVKDGIDYKPRIEKVAGCININGTKNSVKMIRSLRDGE